MTKKFTLMLLVFMASCGQQSSEEEPIDLATQSAGLPQPSSKTTPITNTSTNSNTSITPDRQVDLPSSVTRIFWTPSLSLTNQVTNQTTVPLRVGFLTNIKAVQVNEVSCFSEMWTSYPYSSEVDVAFTGRETLVTLNVRLIATDDTLSSCQSFTFHHDSKPPTAPSIKINNQSVYTDSFEVTVQATSTDAEEVYLTSTINCGYGGVWRSMRSEWSWTLTQANATNVVYAKFRDKAGNEGACVSASIIHDNTSPTGSLKINGDASEAYSSSVTLTLYSSDAKEMAIFDSYSSCSRALSGGWQTYTTTKSWTLPYTATATTASVYVKFRDAAGNTSSCVSDSISVPSIKLTYMWFEGYYYPAYSACGYSYTRDYTQLKTKVVTYAPFTTLSGTGKTCVFSKSGANYYCDWTDSLSNCSKQVMESFCNGRTTYFFIYPNALSCSKPSGVPI